MSRSIKNQMGQGKGFFGDLISSVSQPLGALAGAAFGGPLGGILGGGLGSAISPIAKRLPFRKGGVVSKPKKGSKAMKAKMARLRAMKK
jgi:outer membrane lipoprotein SlyB